MFSFLKQLKPIDGECLSSYIHRVAQCNYASNHELWRLLVPEGSHYPQASMSSILDISPKSFLKTSQFCQMVGIEENTLKLLTFMDVYRKVGVRKEKISHSRILSNQIEKYRKVCPTCLCENRIYLLIWQVKELSYCPIHNVKLVYKCPNCYKYIPILPSDSLIGYCNFCNFDLSTAPVTKYSPTEHDRRIVNDWNYLLNPKSPPNKRIPNFTNEQSIAFKLLYVCSKASSEFNINESTKLKSIFQIARNSKTSQTFIHFDSILYFTRKMNIQLNSFFKLNIPESFISSIFTKDIRLIQKYHCIAPWCKSYLIPGSLKRTATSTKIHEDGQKLNYYMYCECCGIEYCLDCSHTNLIERGYFIKLAWERLKPLLLINNSLNSLIEKLNSTEDKVKRAIIFLAANKLVDSNLLPIEIPKHHDKNMIENIKRLIKEGISARKIQKTLGLKYNSFLFYWFLPEIYIQYINRKITISKNVPDNNVNTLQIQEALNYLMAKNTNITIRNVCSYLSICPETVRNWGGLELIKQAKEVQNKEIIESKRKIYKTKAEELIKQAKSTNETLSSVDLYLKLGINRTVLVRKMPDVTNYIHQLLLDAKPDYKQNI